MKQLKYPDLGITYRGGWCEKGVENAFGTNGIYTSAMVAWKNNVQHTDSPPIGLYVPIYIDLPNGPKDGNGTQGDAAISCPDGTIAACALSGKNTGMYKYSSLQAYINDYARNNGGAIFKGWGEYVGKLKVVGDDDMADKTILTKLWAGYADQYPAPDSFLDYWDGKPISEALDWLGEQPIHIDLINKARSHDDVLKVAEDRLKDIETLQKQLNECESSCKNISTVKTCDSSDIEKDTNTKVNWLVNKFKLIFNIK